MATRLERSKRLDNAVTAPGPWAVHNHVILDADGKMLAHLLSQPTKGHLLANGQLIAASWSLLDAAARVLERADKPGQPPHARGCLCLACGLRAAVAMATGELE